MLLQHLYEFAQSRKLLDDLAFKPKAVRWIIRLDDHGRLLGAGPEETTDGNKNRGKEFNCPQTTRPKVAGGVAEFLADGITSIFCLDQEPGKQMSEKKREDRDANNLRKFEDFWTQITQARHSTSMRELSILLKYKPKAGETPSFLRWGEKIGMKTSGNPTWWITKSNGEEVKLGTDNFTFRVAGKLLLDDETKVRPFWRDCYEKENMDAETNAPKGICLVTGKEKQPIALTHNPKIQGVPNTQSFGAAICSFDKDAFASYGLEQSLNASTSNRAATSYCLALNAMLKKDDHSIRLGQAACCFWSRNHSNTPNEWGNLLNQADPNAVAKFLKTPWVGKERELLQQEEFYAVTLAGNSGRIVVKHWFQTTLEQAGENLRLWFEDLDLVPVCEPTGKEKMPPLALFRLACSTVRDAKDLQPDVTMQLFRAGLEGTSPPVSFLQPLLNRLRVDMARDGQTASLNHSRFALAKLILNRNKKEFTMTIGKQLHPDDEDNAYQCGRLLAILSEAQAKAHGYKLEGAGITERYFGTAMSSPASVFPLIIKLNRHHLNKIGKSERYIGHERFLDEAIQDTMSRIKQFPRTLDLHAQGRFALGFYQQKAADRIAREQAKPKKETLNQS